MAKLFTVVLTAALALCVACSDDTTNGKDIGTQDVGLHDLPVGMEGGGDHSVGDTNGPTDQGGGGTDGPKLSTNLKPNCYGWPQTEFSPSNYAPWKATVVKGQMAVDFTLKDTSGASHTLSQLLKTKPVWLQLGSYT